MRRLILALSLAFLLLAVPGFTWIAYGFADSQPQAQLTAPSYHTVDWDRVQYRYHYWRHDYDRPYYYGYYDPYYAYPYPYTYYYGPGFSVDVPFFHFGIY
jgi:hypothetical protein